MLVAQYIPSFATGIEPYINKFNSLDELLNIEWINRHTRNPDFYKFSISKPDNLFMVEHDEGYRWFVIGKLYDINSSLELPKWKAKEDN